MSTKSKSISSDDLSCYDSPSSQIHNSQNNLNSEKNDEIEIPVIKRAKTSKFDSSTRVSRSQSSSKIRSESSYRTDVSLQNRKNTLKGIACRYFKFGFCRYGSMCEFQHSNSNSQEDSKINTPPKQESNKDSKVQPQIISEYSSNLWISSSSAENNSSSSSRSNSNEREKLKNKRRRKQIKNRFSSSGRDSRSRSNSSKRGKKSRNNPLRQVDITPSKSLKKERRRSRSKSSFANKTDLSKEIHRNSSMNKRVCIFWDNGYCKNGNKCEFQHYVFSNISLKIKKEFEDEQIINTSVNEEEKILIQSSQTYFVSPSELIQKINTLSSGVIKEAIAIAFTKKDRDKIKQLKKSLKKEVKHEKNEDKKNNIREKLILQCFPKANKDSNKDQLTNNLSPLEQNKSSKYEFLKSSNKKGEEEKRQSMIEQQSNQSSINNILQIRETEHFNKYEELSQRLQSLNSSVIIQEQPLLDDINQDIIEKINNQDEEKDNKSQGIIEEINSQDEYIDRINNSNKIEFNSSQHSKVISIDSSSQNDDVNNQSPFQGEQTGIFESLFNQQDPQIETTSQEAIEEENSDNQQEINNNILLDILQSSQEQIQQEDSYKTVDLMIEKSNRQNQQEVMGSLKTCSKLIQNLKRQNGNKQSHINLIQIEEKGNNNVITQRIYNVAGKKKTQTVFPEYLIEEIKPISRKQGQIFVRLKDAKIFGVTSASNAVINLEEPGLLLGANGKNLKMALKIIEQQVTMQVKQTKQGNATNDEIKLYQKALDLFQNT